VYNTDAVLFGAIGDPKYDNDPEAKLTGARIVEIEKRIRSFANIRPIYSTLLDSSPLKLLKVLILLFLELTGGVYFGEKIKRIWNYSF
jgi:3-isopropylmalate dehydrogenase